MRTSHEKIQGFESVKKKRTMPEDFNLNLILLKDLILKMTDPKPSQRPIATKIYENFLKNTENLFLDQNSSA